MITALRRALPAMFRKGAAVQSPTADAVERAARAACSNLADVGAHIATHLQERTAAASWPYRIDVSPARLALLATASRAGLIIVHAQDARCGTGEDGAWWDHRASLTVLAAPALAIRLHTVATTSGLNAHIVRSAPACTRASGAPTITMRAGRPFAGAPLGLSRRQLRQMLEGYGDPAISTALEAYQITVADPAWPAPGVDGDCLWRALGRVGASAEAWR